MRDFIKNSWFVFLFIIVVAIIAIPVNNASAQTGAISLDHTVGRLGQSDSLACGQPIEFHLRTLNNTGGNILAINGVFQVHSPDSGLWSPIVMDTVPLGWEQNYFDGSHWIINFSVTGSGADTVWYTGWVISLSGLPDGFDSVTWIISTFVDCSQEGKTICIDSVTDGQAGADWVWNSTGLPYLAVPTWDGPHCFTIINCCSGIRGDLNYDGKSANILDLSFMVDFIFRGSKDPGDCIVSRDINGDGKGPNILDLSFLVDFIFRGGPPPGACP